MELAIRCALAQEESRNMSENIMWGYKRKFERGDYFVNYKRFMGYRCGNGNLEIIPEEAQTIRMIFYMYLMGKTLNQIKDELEKENIKTATGKDNWSTYVIQKMLKNEKYAGCTLMQKTYCPNYMTGIRKINRGEVEQYYMEDTHPAIISKDIYQKVQKEMEKRERVIHHTDGTLEINKKAYDLFVDNISKETDKLIDRIKKSIFKSKLKRHIKKDLNIERHMWRLWLFYHDNSKS